MGLANVFRSLCCCGQKAWRNAEAKETLLNSGSHLSQGSGCDSDVKTKVDQGWIPWESPQVTSPVTETGSDSELHTFIKMRNQVDKDTEEWEKLNYDIHILRCTMRQVSARWKKILLQMGYQSEVESLLEVNRPSVRMSMFRARELLHMLEEETSLFPRGFRTPEKYLFIMDRLLSLDSAEDFFQLAKEKYPKH